ncbi:hypothetical protein BH09MYX1_BH09MYX1_57800 [soil metagenome]
MALALAEGHRGLNRRIIGATKEVPMARVASLTFFTSLICLTGLTSLLVACGGATESDLFGTPPGTNDGGTTVDTGFDVGPIPDGSNCGACGTAAPAGFHYVAYNENRTTACPSGTKPSDVVSNVGDSIGCTCPCKVNPPDCAVGNIARPFDQDPNNATCNQMGATLNAAAPTCTVLQNQIGLGNHIQVNPPTIQGTCISEGTADLTSVKPTEGRLCDAPTECTGVVCGGPKKCIAQAGDVACPSGFPNKTVVGTSVTAKCEACGACKAEVVCTGTLSFYTDTACGTGQVDMTADSTCGARPSASIGKAYSAYKYAGSVKSATCTPPPDTKGTPSLEGQSTVCCAGK